MVEHLILWQFIMAFAEVERMCLLCTQLDKYLVSR